MPKPNSLLSKESLRKLEIVCEVHAQIDGDGRRRVDAALAEEIHMYLSEVLEITMKLPDIIVYLTAEANMANYLSVAGRQ